LNHGNPTDHEAAVYHSFQQIKRFDGHPEESLRQDIGFFLGMLHGGVLTPEGTLRPDANTLVILHTRNFREGYARGRRGSSH
jgi:hypothetical protein